MKGVYIPSIDAKDIYLAHNTLTGNKEYTLKYMKDNKETYNLRKFVNVLDYSLDLIKLEEIYFKKYRNRRFKFKHGHYWYTVNTINITFKYSVRDWNQMNKNTYVALGYDYRDLKFADGIATNAEGEIVGVCVNVKIDQTSDKLPQYFKAVKVPIIDKKTGVVTGTELQYHIAKPFKTLMTNSQLRHELYKNGFNCDGVHYCRMKRSAGSARVGKCLFCNEVLFPDLLKFSSGGIKFNEGDELDLAAYESYISLPSSSIIDLLPIEPKNILLIDDYESVFKENVVATRNIDGWLQTKEETCEITNSIWDGQSLLDVSMFGKYEQYGMVLLRNLMFKSCCFNCNIQQWFKDNGITDISQLNGETIAEDIEDIKLITTPSSIKYLKFDTFENWLKYLYPEFGLVKHDKKTHYFGGRMVQTHYQLLNTLQLSKEDMEEFLAPSLEFAQLLRDNPAVVRYYIKYPDIDEIDPLYAPMLDKNDVVYNLMCINDNFVNTKYYQDFIVDLIRAYYKNLKNGHVYVNGNYSTLLGNPVEMLLQSIGNFTGESQLGVGNVHSTRFEYGKVILGSRSPHISISNVWLPHNTANKMIDRYFNLTDEIVCINSIGENVLQKLSGADFDSDTVLLTDNDILIKAALKNSETFKVSTSFVSAKKIKRYYTAEQQADLDITTSENLIGEIINLSQELNSLLWDKMYDGAVYEDIKYLYYDICQLDTLSGTAIDAAKKEFDINIGKELEKIRQKWQAELQVQTEDGKIKKRLPHFFAHVSRQKGYYAPDKKDYSKYHTAMDYLQTVVNSYRIRHPFKERLKRTLPFTAILDSKRFRTNNVYQKQINKIYSLCKNYIKNRQALFGYHRNEKDKKDLFLKSHILYDELIENINTEYIGFSTMFRLLTSLESDENKGVKKLLLQILFLCGNDSFKSAIIQSVDEIEEIEYGGNDLYIFDMGYTITKKKVKTEINTEYDTKF